VNKGPHSVASMSPASCRSLTGILFDIDDTVTSGGKLVPESYAAMWAIKQAGLRLIAVTGRPAGWADQIARLWPVDGVVGENGGLWFFQGPEKLERRFLQGPPERKHNKKRLEELAAKILSVVPGSALASDQAYRELDLAIDFCEDVERLSPSSIKEICRQFTLAGSTHKVSSIHVNGWFGDFDKWTGCSYLIREFFSEELEDTTEQWAYFGDSANDEPMFKRFNNSIGVANVRAFLPMMTHHPKFICDAEGGAGFAQGVQHILDNR
jgi:HAD superfamily hydrolase (TIGR01484 family)